MASKRRKTRKGEIDAMYFSKLPTRCQEMFFEFMQEEMIKKKDAYWVFEVVGFCYDDFCESPIEIIFNFAVDIISTYEFGGKVWLEPQHGILDGNKEYIADFCFDTQGEFRSIYTPEHDYKIIIECDGHNFHSTKQQIKHDNEKDLAFKKQGYDVLHFSGSQIFNEPWKCARETIEYILSKTGKIGNYDPTKDGVHLP